MSPTKAAQQCDNSFPLIERKVINRFAGHFLAEEVLTITGLLERY